MRSSPPRSSQRSSFSWGSTPSVSPSSAVRGGVRRSQASSGSTTRRSSSSVRSGDPMQMIYMAPDLVDEKEVEATLKPDGLILINNALTTNEFIPCASSASPWSMP